MTAPDGVHQASPAPNGTRTGDGYAPIGDYGLIGNCRTAGLVSRDGSLDWLCLPRFDSPSVFGALLDAQKGGYFRVRPLGPYRVQRRYVPQTNVLETTFVTASGAAMVRDCFTVSADSARHARLAPEHEIVRTIEGIAGSLELEVVYAPRPNFGLAEPLLEDRGAWGIWCQVEDGALVLRGEAPLTLEPAKRQARGVLRVQNGDRRALSLAYCQEAPAVLPPLGAEAHRRLGETVRWWERWAHACAYAGPYRDAVVRSALALKLLAYAPSGAIIAAPTTSLPEKMGGVRNWDYRFCWLRDASFTLRALSALGYEEEARAFLSWLLHATSQTWPRLQVVYDLFGGAHLPERTLDHLDGYRGARPVRVGNEAYEQLQLDVYGEVIEAAAYFALRGGYVTRDNARMLGELGKTVARRWREPDDGIWEERSERRHHTHSKVMCWVALDRLLDMDHHGLLRVPREWFIAERDALRTAIEAEGYNSDVQSYVRTFGGTVVDAALLLLPVYGFAARDDPRTHATLARISRLLGRGALMYRYEASTDDGLPPGEGAFGLCSFWAVQTRAYCGDLGGARDAFDELLGYANDLGLYAEEIDVATGAALGNFPQAFTHVGLINAALALAEYETGTAMPTPEQARETLAGA